jgi:ABC-type multidrug transport system fused ATPase/permease subunit
MVRECGFPKPKETASFLNYISKKGNHMPEPDQQSTVTANIPFLFYDVIGRMFPGGFLIIGTFLSSLHFLPSYCFDCCLKATKVSETSVGFATLVIGLAVLLFAATSTFLGFILAALSNVLVEKMIWRRCNPFDLKGLSKFLGIDIAFLKTQFQLQFGSDPKDDSLNQSSFLCAYYGWKINPNLGTMQGRWDSDLLAAQSFVLVSVALIAMAAIEGFIVGFDLFLIVWLIVLAIILCGSCLAFDYHRKKRVYGRFGLFLALSSHAHDKGDAGVK